MNYIQYTVRNKITFQKKGVIKLNEPKRRIDVTKQEKEIIHKYKIEKWRNESPAHEYYVSLHYLTILETFLPHRAINTIIDVGSKDFFYASVMHAFFKQNNPRVKMKGIEIDGYRRYENWFTRSDYANHYIKDIPGVKYLVTDFLKTQQHADIITMFLPFMTIEPLQNWGLPKKIFTPSKMINHAYKLLNEGGMILIVNQYPEEQNALFDILDNLEILYQNKGSYYSPFYNKYNHYITVIEKKC